MRMRSRLWAVCVLTAVVIACGGESRSQSGGPAQGQGGSSAGAGGSTAGTGGTAAGGWGGKPGEVELTDETCTGEVAFHVSAKDPSKYCHSNCGVSVGMLDAAGLALPTRTCGDTSCAACGSLGCPAIACLNTPLPDDGIVTTWSGGFAEPATCNSATPCKVIRCAPSGSYTAKVCLTLAHDRIGCEGPGTSVCKSVGIEFPASEVVEVEFD